MQLQNGTILREGKYNYKIIRVLGQGGFGITYLATMTFQVEGALGVIESEVKVAIKEFFMKELCNRDEATSHVSVGSVGSKDLVERFRRKFIKEANNISTLKHNNIIKVIEVFEENGTAYYVMEYLEGGSLQELVKQRGTLKESEGLCYIRQIAEALAYIHQKKMNHLDIKPANILLKQNGDVVLIDFGLSKQYDEKGEQTSSTPIGVSVGYAPIEQSRPGGVGQFSAPTDIYSLGATLYKLLTGETPPDASDIVSDGFPRLSGTISEKVALAIEKAMEPNRRNRPQSVMEFLNLLGSISIVEDDINAEAQSDKKTEETTVLLLEDSRKDKNINENTIIETFSVGNVSFDMVYVQGGTFSMGATQEQANDADQDEYPVHQVTLNDYYIGKATVTQALWEAAMRNNPSYQKGNDLPVEQISWDDCQIFIRNINRLTGKNFRLPTEAEWEFAARGGLKSKGYKYSGSDNVNEICYGTYQIQHNELGIYNMSGGVREWCMDWYGKYTGKPEMNPTGPVSGFRRVCRGDMGWSGTASWVPVATCYRVSKRNSYSPDFSSFTLGFRLAFDVK